MRSKVDDLTFVTNSAAVGHATCVYVLIHMSSMPYCRREY
jgi:hypothetical protein